MGSLTAMILDYNGEPYGNITSSPGDYVHYIVTTVTEIVNIPADVLLRKANAQALAR